MQPTPQPQPTPQQPQPAPQQPAAAQPAQQPTAQQRQQNVIDLAAIAKDFGQQMLRNIQYNAANADAVDDARNQRNMRVRPSQLINMDTGGDAHYGRDHGMYCRCPRHFDPSDAVQYGWVPFVTSKDTVGAYNADLMPPNNRLYGEKAKRVLAGVKAAARKKENAGARAGRADAVLAGLQNLMPALGATEQEALVNKIVSMAGDRKMLSGHGLARIAAAIGIEPKGKKANDLRAMIAEQLKRDLAAGRFRELMKKEEKPPDPPKPKEETFAEWKKQADDPQLRRRREMERWKPGAAELIQKLKEFKKMGSDLRELLPAQGRAEIVDALGQMSLEALRDFVVGELKIKGEDEVPWYYGVYQEYAEEKLKELAKAKEDAERAAAAKKRGDAQAKAGDDPRNVLYDKVINSESLGGGAFGGHVSAAYKVTFASGFQAVWKPADEDNADGLRKGIDGGTTWKREASYYEVSRLTGCADLAAPSVARDDSYGRGSMQLWQEGDLAKRVSVSDRYDGDDDCTRAAMLDLLCNNTDRHKKNWIVNHGKLRLIDNGLSFPDMNHPHSFEFNQNILAKAVKDHARIPVDFVENLLMNRDKIVAHVYNEVGVSAAKATSARIAAILKEAEEGEGLIENITIESDYGDIRIGDRAPSGADWDLDG